MIPATWQPYHRGDGELSGYLAPHPGDQVVPMTIIGTPVGDPSDLWTAEQLLDEIGLSYLTERWLLRLEDGSERPVALVEADPERVVVVPAEFALVVGMPRSPGDEVTLDVPTDRLRRA